MNSNKKDFVYVLSITKSIEIQKLSQRSLCSLMAKEETEAGHLFSILKLKKELCRIWYMRNVQLCPYTERLLMNFRFSKTKKGSTSLSNVKMNAHMFFDFNGILHHEFLPRCERVNKEYYLQIQCRLLITTLKKCGVLWKTLHWFHSLNLLHFIAYSRIFDHKQYCNDAPTSIFAKHDSVWLLLFPKMKITLNCCLFISIGWH